MNIYEQNIEIGTNSQFQENHIIEQDTHKENSFSHTVFLNDSQHHPFSTDKTGENEKASELISKVQFEAKIPETQFKKSPPRRSKD